MFLRGLYHLARNTTVGLAEGRKLIKQGYCAVGISQILARIIFVCIYPVIHLLYGHWRVSAISQCGAMNVISKLWPFFRIRFCDQDIKLNFQESDLQIYSVFKEIFIDNVYNIRQSIRTDAVVIDVGANIGFYSVALAKLIIQGRIIAVEPEPANLKSLHHNLALNNINNVQVEEIALGNFKGTAKLFLKTSVGHSLKQCKDHLGSHISVDVDTLDSLCRKLNINRIDILKIDVEGSEKDVLEGAHDMLNRGNIAKVIVAAYHYPQEINEIKYLLNGFGYNTEVGACGIIFSRINKQSS